MSFQLGARPEDIRASGIVIRQACSSIVLRYTLDFVDLPFSLNGVANLRCFVFQVFH